jgi:hypothetical protein
MPLVLCTCPACLVLCPTGVNVSQKTKRNHTRATKLTPVVKPAFRNRLQVPGRDPCCLVSCSRTDLLEVPLHPNSIAEDREAGLEQMAVDVDISDRRESGMDFEMMDDRDDLVLPLAPIGAVNDDLEVPPPPLPAMEVFMNSSDHWFWRIIMVLVSWLHLHYHLPHRGCILLLKILSLIFVHIGILKSDSGVPVTLTTNLKHLGLLDEFMKLPTCPGCKRVHPASIPPNSLCSGCEKPLFKPAPIYDLPREPNVDVSSGSPYLVTPFLPLSAHLPGFLNRANIETACTAWETAPPARADEVQTVQQARIWNDLKGVDGKPFFMKNPDHSELRLGIQLGFDGFSYQKSRNAANHSSGVLSCCVANLPYNLKYQARNLIICGITPGPKEFTSDELQFFLKIFVDDLIKLYEEGIIIATPEYPAGRRVRVILIAVCCDHPALCRVCGFGDHNHKASFCTKCKIKHNELRTEQSMTGGFEPRNGKEHCRNARKWRDENDPELRDSLFKENASRYFELSRLEYFDPVRMTIIDPMHNILLGGGFFLFHSVN